MQNQQELIQTTYQYTQADITFINKIYLKMKNEGIRISEAEFRDLLRPFFKQGFRTKGTLEILNPLLDYLPHKFIMREALFLNRYIKGLLHPTKKEIDLIVNRLKEMENQNEFPLIKLMIESNNEPINCDTIIVIGGNNVGKEIFICNLINYLYNVDYYGVFRANIESTEQSSKCIEYVVHYDTDQKTNEEKYIKIINCPVIGNIIQDQMNCIDILEKISKLDPNQIIGIFLVNSACKTRLGIEEKYIIQRFFEMFEKNYLENIFLILTSSTDNMANTEIYLSNDSPTPTIFKERISASFQNSTQANKEGKFQCFAFNNNCIYQIACYDHIYPPLNDIQNEIRSTCLRNFDQTQTDTESVKSSKQDEFNDMFFQYWNKDSKSMGELLNKLQNIKDHPQQSQSDNSYFVQVKTLEEQLNNFFELFRVEQVEEFQSKVLVNRFYLQTKIISITKSEGVKVFQGAQALFCNYCHIVCHKECWLTKIEGYEELEQNQLCRKFEGENLRSRECSNCKKFNNDSKCPIQNHQLLPKISVIDIYQDSQPNDNQCTAIMLREEYLRHKREKREHQLRRLEYYKNQKEKEAQRRNIVKNIEDLKSQKKGLVDINLNIRLQFVNESIKIKSNDNNQENLEYLICQKMYESLRCCFGQNVEIQSNNDLQIYQDLSPQREYLRNSAIYNNGQAPMIPSYNSHKK